MSRRVLVSDSHVCPYCGSERTRGSGSKAGQRKFSCQECGKHFGSKIPVEGFDVGGAALYLYKYRIEFPVSALEQLRASEGDLVTFDWDEGRLHLRTGEGLPLVPRAAASKSMMVYSVEIASAIRDEMGVPYAKSVNVKLDEEGRIVGIIKKSDIRRGVPAEVDLSERKLFVSVRPNGSTYFSALLCAALQLGRGDYVMLAESDGAYYILKAGDGDNKEDGFRLSANAFSGFRQHPSIASDAFAAFLCQVTGHDFGDPFRVYCEIISKERTMAKLLIEDRLRSNPKTSETEQN